MKFVMFTYVGEQGVAEWEAMGAEARAAYVDQAPGVVQEAPRALGRR